MTIKAGDKMPEGAFTRMTKDGPQKMTTEQLFAGKTVVLFSVPGAFTPTCDAKHLPGFVELADQIKAKGVDTIACTAVNDVFVMNAWGKHGGVGDKILMLADGNGAYVKALGLELDGTKFGMGMRGQRFAVIVKNGVATHVNVEAPGEFKVSAADYAPLREIGPIDITCRRWRRGVGRHLVFRSASAYEAAGAMVVIRNSSPAP